MKSILLIALALHVLTLPAPARLGENEGQLSARYGAGHGPSRQSQAMGVMPNNRFYHAQGYDITVVLGDRTLTNGQRFTRVSVSESYEAPSSGGGLSAEAIRVLLDANKGNSTWEGPFYDCTLDCNYAGRCWKTKDGLREARTCQGLNGGDALWIVWKDVPAAPKGF